MQKVLREEGNHSSQPEIKAQNPNVVEMRHTNYTSSLPVLSYTTEVKSTYP